MNLFLLLFAFWNFYERAKNEMLVDNYGEVSMRAEDKVTGQQNIFDMLVLLP